MRVIKQGSTPTILFLLVSSTNHVSGLATGATPVVYIGKGASGTGALSTNTATAVDTANLPGWYRLALTATETNSIGDLVVHASATGADDTDRLFYVESNDISGITTDIAAKASQTSVTAIPTNPLLTTDSRLNNLDAQVSTRLATSGYTAPPATVVLAANQTCNITGNLSGSVGSVTGSVGSVAGSVGGSVASVTGGVTLIAAYDAAKSAASQASVSAIPTNPLLTTDVRLNNLDAQVSTRLATSGYTAPPATVTLAASQPNYAPAKTTDIATLATQTSVNTIDTKITAIKAQTDQFSFVTGKVNANATATVDTAAIDAALAAPGSAMSLAHGTGSWQTGSGGGGGSGTGDTPVNHDFGGTDALRYLTSLGTPVDNGVIVAYLTSSYVAGNLSSPKASTMTRSDGRWQSPLMLDHGVTYTLLFYKQGAYGTTTVEVTP